MLRDGTAPEIIRRKGAEGSLPVSLEEKLEILAVLCGDQDERIRNRAFDTLQGWNVQELQQILSSPSAPLTLIEFATKYLAAAREEIRDALLNNPQLSADRRASNKSLRIGPAAVPAPAATQSPAPADAESPGELAEEEKRLTLLQKISKLTAPEKIKLALVGVQEERLILVRDSNKMVARAVLESPKLSDQEIENIAGMKNVTEEVLRLIGSNRKFMKNYPVVRALVNNPRAPLDVTLNLVNRLNDRDQKYLTLNKNIPDVLRTTAVKILKQKEEAKRVKIPGAHH